MKFLAIIYNDESQYADATPEDIAATFQAHGEFGEAAGEAGVFARRRRPAADRDGDHACACATASGCSPTARTRRPRSSSAATTCSSARTSTTRCSWAARIPEAKTGAVEVRPVMDYEAMRR